MLKKLTIVAVTSIMLTTAALADASPSSALQVGGKGGQETTSQNPSGMAAPAVSACVGDISTMSTSLRPGGKDGAYALRSHDVASCSATVGGNAVHGNYSKS